jgi:hypothetical protein
MEAFPHKNPFAHGSICFRKEVLINVGMYREILDGAEDYDLFWRMCELYRGHNLSEVLYHHRRTGTSVSTAGPQKQARAIALTRFLAHQRQQNKFEDIDAAVAVIDKKLQGYKHKIDMILKNADHLMLAGSYKKAFARYIEAIVRNPFLRYAWFKTVRFVIFRCFPISAVRSYLFRKRK